MNREKCDKKTDKQKHYTEHSLFLMFVLRKQDGRETLKPSCAVMSKDKQKTK